MKENGKDILLGAHLKVVDGRIAEADQFVARDNVNGSRQNLVRNTD